MIPKYIAIIGIIVTLAVLVFLTWNVIKHNYALASISFIVLIILFFVTKYMGKNFK